MSEVIKCGNCGISKPDNYSCQMCASNIKGVKK